MEYSDLHIHTVFSDGIHTMEEMVRAAAKRNFVSIGISDHSYTAFDRSYCMSADRLDEYHAELARLKAVYADRIEVYAGLEQDGYSAPVDRSRYDYLIGDCHYIRVGQQYFSVDHDREIQKNTVEQWFGGDALAYARVYFDTYVERMRLCRPDVLGHFDLAAKFGLVDENSPLYRSMALEALLAVLEVVPVLEMNTGAIARGLRKEAYPNRFLLREVLLHGGQILLSGDAHNCRMLGFAFDEAMELLRESGFRSVVMLRQGTFQEVGID